MTNIQYTAAQQQVIDAYLEATKDNVDVRLPLSKIIAIKKHIPKYKPDKIVLLKCERDYLDGGVDQIVGRHKRQIDNKVCSSLLSKYNDYYQAKEQHWWLDDILVGVSRLDLGGNTRPLSVVLLYNFISTSSVINTTIIMSFCSVAVRQAQKILLSLSIAVRLIEKSLLLELP